MSEKRSATWGEILERHRLERKISVRTAAAGCKCSVEKWNDLVTGKAWPNGRTKENIYTVFRSMRAHEALMTRERDAAAIRFAQEDLDGCDENTKSVVVTAVATGRLPPVSSNAPRFSPLRSPAVARPLSLTGVPFHQALRSARRHNGLTMSELAELMGVHPQTPGNWEDATVVPIQDHYDKLVQLFPEIETAEKPSSRDISKPGAPLGGWSATTSTAVPLVQKEQSQMAAPPIQPPPSSNPPSAAESFKDGVKFATLLGTLATGRDANKVLEVLQIAKQRGLTIDDMLSLMTEASK